jgi:hypothetical protein
MRAGGDRIRCHQFLANIRSFNRLTIPGGRIHFFAGEFDIQLVVKCLDQDL